jgi:hypothetical protein
MRVTETRGFLDQLRVALPLPRVLGKLFDERPVDQNIGAREDLCDAGVKEEIFSLAGAFYRFFPSMS